MIKYPYFHLHLLRHAIFDFPYEEPNLSILFSPNFFTKIKIINYIKIKDEWG